MSTSVIFSWDGPENKRFQGEGSTRDISVGGVFVLTQTCPPSFAPVHLEVILPLSDKASTVQMRAEMTVLRVDHNVAGTGRSGFSAVGPGFLLNTKSERASQAVAELIKDAQKLEAREE